MKELLWILVLTGFLLTGLYAIIAIRVGLSWRKKKGFIFNDDTFPQFFVSVILPVKNEEQKLQECLLSILNQNYPRSQFEVIVVDDYSIDGTKDIVFKLQALYPHLKYISQGVLSNPAGKKKAIETGVSYAKGEIILTTDADCLRGRNWIRVFSRYFYQNPVEMLCGPVELINNKNNLFGYWQVLEFSALSAFSSVFIEWKKPLMCNGANLGYKKEAFMQVGGYSSSKGIASGDDIFLMFDFKREFGAEKIGFLYSKEAMVSTQVERKISNFLLQRIRWAGKNRYVSDPVYSILAIIIALTILIQHFMLLFLPFNKSFLDHFLFLVSLKCITDLVFFQLIGKSGFKWNLVCIIGQAINLIYVPLTVVFSLFVNVSWKESKLAEKVESKIA